MEPQMAADNFDDIVLDQDFDEWNAEGPFDDVDQAPFETDYESFVSDFSADSHFGGSELDFAGEAY